MRRREFIAGLAGAAAGPLAARAQQPMPVIGYLSVTSLRSAAPFLTALRQGLSEIGYVEGQNVAIEYRFAEGQYDRLPELAADLVRHQVNVIVAASAPREAKAATASIPIIAGFTGDPVKSGLVESLSRPGGNITGVAIFGISLAAKRLELLRELVPNAKTIAVLVNPNNTELEFGNDVKAIEDAARLAGRQTLIVNVSSASDLEGAFATMVQHRIGALLAASDPALSVIWRDELVAQAARHAIPAIWNRRDVAEVGGLMSYSASFTEAYRQMGVYTGKILKGAKPADLPVMQAVKVELVLNLKTAKTLGLTFPLTLLARADEVIE